MGAVVSRWEHERIADYGGRGVALGTRTFRGLWDVWCRAGSKNSSRIRNQFENKCWSDNLSF